MSNFSVNDVSAGLILCLVLFCLWCGSGREALAASHYVKYLNVEANEGDSSGGHTAIRFDHETFHFLHDTSGKIRIQRLDSTKFDHIYAVLGNRGIHESWIEVSEDTYALLLDGFTQFVLIQDQQMSTLDTLRRDVSLFEFLLKKIQHPDSPIQLASFPLKGLGYFIADDVLSAAIDSDERLRSASPIINSLKSRISSCYGESFIEQRTAMALSAIGTLSLHTAMVGSPSLYTDIFPPFIVSASAAYTDALLALSALQLLQAGPGLVQGSYWSSSSDSFRLTPEESQFLRTFAEKLANDLLSLVNSSRSDWGFPFIAGMARLASIEASLNSGNMVFLDVFPETSEQSNLQTISGRQYLPAMKKEAEALFLLKRREFFNSREMREADFAALERLANRLLEFERSLGDDVMPRQLPEMPVPSRPVILTNLPFPDIDETDLKQELESARSIEKEYAKDLSNLYGYDLLKRNCVTEIFSIINKSLTRLSAVNEKDGHPAAVKPFHVVKEESLQRLGGYIDPQQGLTFIPVISAGEVEACYRVTVKRETPSYRAAQLAEMKKRESALLVFLRESNTITSTLYRPAPNDSFFLFFTDDTVLLRPVFGAFNLLAGLGESVLGLASMPVEGAGRLSRGARGILFSLPELAFINLRKGTFEYVAENRQSSSVKE